MEFDSIRHNNTAYIAHLLLYLNNLTSQGLLWATALTKYVEYQISNNSSILVGPETYKITYSTNMAEEVNKMYLFSVFILL